MLYWIFEQWSAAFQAEIADGVDGWAHTFSFLNIFRYITFRAILGCMLTFFLSILFGEYVIRKLISLKIGQPVRSAEEVHKLFELHGAKAGTPTMGGVMILGNVLLAVLICTRPLNPFVAVTMFVMLSLGLLGFMDDYTKVVKKNSEGVSGRQKLFWQFVIGLIAALFLYSKNDASTFLLLDKEISFGTFTIPLSKVPIFELGVFMIPFFIVIIMGSSNAVNLTDGLDGLAIGCTITVGCAYAVIVYLASHQVTAEYLSIPRNPQLGELTILLLALVGAGFGFLWFNCHPAKVFMGDTGSLAIGGALGTVAICSRQELLLVIIGGVFVMEALSVIIQVISFKSTGKRVFRMSPIHHHFELGGWKENQVIIRFWTLSIMFALTGLALLKVV